MDHHQKIVVHRRNVSHQNHRTFAQNHQTYVRIHVRTQIVVQLLEQTLSKQSKSTNIKRSRSATWNIIITLVQMSIFKFSNELWKITNFGHFHKFTLAKFQALFDWITDSNAIIYQMFLLSRAERIPWLVPISRKSRKKPMPDSKRKWHWPVRLKRHYKCIL